MCGSGRAVPRGAANISLDAGNLENCRRVGGQNLIASRISRADEHLYVSGAEGPVRFIRNSLATLLNAKPATIFVAPVAPIT